MKVRVKEGMTGFFGGVLRKEGQEFTIKEREHSKDVDEDGKPVKISIESQFSDKWMDDISPKKAVKKETSEKTKNKK